MQLSSLISADDTLLPPTHGGEVEIKGLTADSRIRDLLNHPAFAGFGRLLLPWDDRAYDQNMRLGDLASLPPYHSQVDPATVVGALNHMIDDVNSGKPVFHDVYTEEEKLEQPARRHTGLFFFRGKGNGQFDARLANLGGLAR